MRQKNNKTNKQSPYACRCLWPEWWQAWFLLAPCQCIARGCPRVSEAVYPLATCVERSSEIHRHWCMLSFLFRDLWATHTHTHARKVYHLANTWEPRRLNLQWFDQSGRSPSLSLVNRFCQHRWHSLIPSLLGKEQTWQKWIGFSFELQTRTLAVMAATEIPVQRNVV